MSYREEIIGGARLILGDCREVLPTLSGVDAGVSDGTMHAATDTPSRPRRYKSTRVHGNMWGFRGIEWSQRRKLFGARIESVPGKRGRWLGWFGSAEQAALAYDEAARQEYGEDAHLNFPKAGEASVQRSTLRLGQCAEGHDLNISGRINVHGYPYCKACNLAAANRYRARKAAAQP